MRATLDVPTSFTEGFPLRDLAVNAGSIRFSIPLGEGMRLESGEWRRLPLLIPGAGGESAKLEFEGKIEGENIRGKVTGIPFPGTFHLRRARAENPLPAALSDFTGWGRKARDYWPTREWKISTPAAEGIDPHGLAEAEQVILETKPQVRSLLVIRHGRLVYEKYFRGASAAQVFNVKSVTKSFMSARRCGADRAGCPSWVTCDPCPSQRARLQPCSIR